MSMVRITNGEVSSRVPYAAYISMYKKLGFTIEGEEPVKPQKKDETPKVKEKKEEEKQPEKEDEATEEEVDEDEEDEEADDEAFVEDILEKPLSQWTPDELKKFAEIKDIDTSKAKKVSEARAIIKKYLDEQAKAQA